MPGKDLFAERFKMAIPSGTSIFPNTHAREPYKTLHKPYRNLKGTLSKLIPIASLGVFSGGIVNKVEAQNFNEIKLLRG